MNFRPYRREDEAKVRLLYERQGYTFEFPDLSAPDAVAVQVAEDDGLIVAVSLARKTVEMVVMIDREYANPAWRLEVLQKQQCIMDEKLSALGFTDMHAFVKSEIRGFARRLVRNMGWVRSLSGECFVRGCHGKKRH